jgi:thiosulfate/3-mercaptopyruvate sulfurtransferase
MVPPVVPLEWWRSRRDEVVLVYVLRAGGAQPRGGVVVDLERWLSGPPTPQDGRHPLPPPEVFAEGMAAAGIGADDTVVAYDDAAGVFAARLVWMLRVTGHPAALLDGVPDVSAAGPRPRGVFPARPWPASAVASPEDALDPANVVVDARPRERFAGAPDPLDPRPGHVPGARSLPCREHVGPDGRLLPASVLRPLFAQAGVVPGAPVVAYCGSGVTACHDLLVMEHLGLGSGRLYPGSWSQYASDPDRAVELG